MEINFVELKSLLYLHYILSVFSPFCICFFVFYLYWIMVIDNIFEVGIEYRYLVFTTLKKDEKSGD